MIQSYFKEAKDHYSNNVGYKSSLAALYGFIIVLVFVAAYFLPMSLILTVPFFVLPFTFALITANASLNTPVKNPYSIFFVCFGRYFHFFGCFRTLFALVKAIVVYLIYSTIISIVVISILSTSSPEFIELMNELQTSTTINLTEFAERLEAIPEFKNGQYLSFVVSFGFASYAFIHHILTNSIKYFMIFSSNKPISSREVNYIHRHSFGRIRKTFYFNYYSVATFMALLFIGGYIGGVLLAYNIFNSNYIQTGIIGLFGGFILNIFLLPLLFDVIEVIYNHSRLAYAETFVSLATRAFEELRKQNKLSEEEIKKAEEMLKGTKEDFDKSKTNDPLNDKKTDEDKK